MKQILVVLLFATMATSSFSQTQVSINETAAKKSAAADKTLNQVYQQVLKEYKSDAAFLKALKTSQKLWIQFRDAELNMMYPPRAKAYYGSMLSSCKSEYLATLSNERTEKLRTWLTGKEEGDSCGSSVKNKK